MMSNQVHHHTISQYIIVNDAKKAIEFYKIIFNAKELFKLEHDDMVDYCELLIGDSVLMLSDEKSMLDGKNTIKTGNYPVSIGINVPDVDAVFKKAIEFGSQIDEPLQNTYWGHRMASIIDPFGIKFGISTHIENVGYDEIARRHKEFVKSMKTSQTVKVGGNNSDYKNYMKYKTKYLSLKRNRSSK
jgi:PhnB protein